MPLKAMDRLLFSRPLVDARDLIKTLIPRYDEVKGYSDSYRHQCQLLSVKKGQEATGIIVEMLENGTEEFCIDFLCFATGNLYLGSSDDKIFVEFNFSEMSPNSLPVAHTCVCTMKLPGQAYEGNRAVFEKKLLYCLKQIKVSRFDME